MTPPYALLPTFTQLSPGRGPWLALGLAAAFVVSCGDTREITAAPPEVPPGPPVALALLAPGGTVYRSPVDFPVALPQRWPAQAVLVDAAGRAAGPPVTVRWESSDTTVVRVGATTGTVTELTGLKVGEAVVTATFVLGGDTLRLLNAWHIQR